MLTYADVAVKKLPFLQDPDHFLCSYFWGCDEGHKLSVRCKHKIERSLHKNCEMPGSKPYLQSIREMMDSVLDCYVHTQICPRCVSMEKVTCQRGYELMETRDSASDQAAKLGVKDRNLDARQIESMTPEQVQASFNKAFAQEKFLHHKSGCEACTLKGPQGRYNIAAWNIEVARSQKLD
jgi:hypothetical protein